MAATVGLCVGLVLIGTRFIFSRRERNAKAEAVVVLLHGIARQHDVEAIVRIVANRTAQIIDRVGRRAATDGVFHVAVGFLVGAADTAVDRTVRVDRTA